MICKYHACLLNILGYRATCWKILSSCKIVPYSTRLWWKFIPLESRSQLIPRLNAVFVIQNNAVNTDYDLSFVQVQVRNIVVVFPDEGPVVLERGQER